MTIKISLDQTTHLMHLPNFTQPIPCQEQDPTDNEPFVHYHTTHDRTGAPLHVRIKNSALQSLGISAQAWQIASNTPERLLQLIHRTWIVDQLLQKSVPIVAPHLSPKYLKFFQEDRSFANRMLNLAIVTNVQHSSKQQGVPGFYIHITNSGIHIFINLKKTPQLGSGSWGKVRKVLWLTPPNGNPEIIAKKVIFNPEAREAHNAALKNEIDALQNFKNKRGIISMIYGKFYEDKWALFLPLYDMNLNTFYTQPNVGMNERLSIAAQLLEGLAALSEEGIHGDISAKNMLEKNGVVVITDFGSYTAHGQPQRLCCTLDYAPPEYHLQGIVTEAHDVWGLGLVLHKLIAYDSPLDEKKDMAKWTAALEPDWIWQYPARFGTPPFLMHLISAMLHPRYTLRITAEDAFQRFVEGCPMFRTLPERQASPPSHLPQPSSSPPSTPSPERDDTYHPPKQNSRWQCVLS